MVEECLSSILNMEAASSFRMLLTNDKIVQCHIPEDSNTDNKCCKYLKSYNETCLQIMIFKEIEKQTHIMFEY